MITDTTFYYNTTLPLLEMQVRVQYTLYGPSAFPNQSTAPPLSSNTDDTEDNNSDDEGSDADDSSNEGSLKKT